MFANVSSSDVTNPGSNERNRRVLKRAVTASHGTLKKCLEHAKRNTPISEDQFCELRAALLQADQDSQDYIAILQKMIDQTSSELTPVEYNSLTEAITNANCQKKI